MSTDTPSVACLDRRAIPMTHRFIHGNVQHSIVDCGGVRRVFAVAGPSAGKGLREQFDSALQDIKSLFDREAVQVVMLSVFVRDCDDIVECRAVADAFYGDKQPPTTYVAQPPCDGSSFAVEAWGLGGPDMLGIESTDDGLTVARHSGAAWTYLGDVRPTLPSGPLHDRAASAFHLADERLRRHGWKFDDVVRAWFYLGNITGPEGQTLRYCEMNRARAEFYRNVAFGGGLTPQGWAKPVFPASTGIGAKGDDLTISCLAVRPDGGDVALLPLENPLQVAAYDYAHQYGPERPKFVRAMAVITGDTVATFISGTASITASESRFDDDIERQTRQTLDNIDALIAADNFRSHGRADLGATLDDLALARVYVKRECDYPAARAICRERLSDLPTVFVIGDICRSELLVEIEAVAFSRKA